MIRHTVIITGATKGLGRATSIAFARAGHRVVGLYASDDSAADSLRAELGPISGDSVVVRHDIRYEGDAFWSRPDIQSAPSLVLINNACAPFTPQPFHLLRWEDYERNLSVGLKGSWRCSLALLRPMLRGRGVIVNVLTAAVHGTPPKGFAAYVVAKHALRGLTLSLASEYAGKNIRVFSVSPGFMSTPLTADWDARLVEAIRAGGTVSDPVEAAAKIVSLVDAPTTRGQGEDYPV